MSLDDGCVAYCHNGSLVNPTHDSPHANRNPWPRQAKEHKEPEKAQATQPIESIDVRLAVRCVCSHGSCWDQCDPGRSGIIDCISVSACCLRIWIKTSIVSLDDGCVAYCHNGSVVNPTHDHLMQTGTLDLVRQRSTRSWRKLRLLNLSNLSTWDLQFELCVFPWVMLGSMWPWAKWYYRLYFVSAYCLRIWIKTSIVSLDDGCVAYCHNGSVVNPTHDHLMQTGTLDLVRQRSTRSRRKLRLLDLSNLSTWDLQFELCVFPWVMLGSMWPWAKWPFQIVFPSVHVVLGFG